MDPVSSAPVASAARILNIGDADVVAQSWLRLG